MNIKQLIFHTLVDCGCIVHHNEETDIVTVIDDNKVEWDFTVPKIVPIKLNKENKDDKIWKNS